MEEELEEKIFYRKDYEEVKQLQQAAEEYAKEKRKEYPDCMVSKEYYQNDNILVRVTTIRQRYKTERILEKEKIRQRETRSRGGRRKTKKQIKAGFKPAFVLL